MRFKLVNTNNGWRVIDTFDDRIIAWGWYSDCKLICRQLNKESSLDLEEAE